MDFVTLKYLLYAYHTRYVSYFYDTRKRALQSALPSGDPVSNKQLHRGYIIAYMISKISTQEAIPRKYTFCQKYSYNVDIKVFYLNLSRLPKDTSPLK